MQHKLHTDSMKGVHVAVQGTGSVGGGVARLLAKDGARLTLADIHTDGVKNLADELGAEVVAPDAILTTECDVLSPTDELLGGKLFLSFVLCQVAPRPETPGGSHKGSKSIKILSILVRDLCLDFLVHLRTE